MIKTNYKLKYLAITLTVFSISISSCKKQLDVRNPNLPTISGNVTTEAGLLSLAQGAVYVNGFINGDGWLGNSYFSLPYGYLELMADNIGADASNNQVTTVGKPDYYIKDDGTKVVNPSPQVSVLHGFNIYGGSGNNPLYFQWLNMYAMNGACNTVLSLADKIPFGGDAASRLKTIQAWCYWWKGYAYAGIGTLYYSGLIQDDPDNKVNPNYKIKDSIIARSNYYFNLAASTLSGITSEGDFSTVLSQLIPSFCQVGHGGVPTTDMWKRNINTMLARNILMNKLSPFVNGNPAATIAKSSTSAMTAADWSSVLQLANDGIKPDDVVFSVTSVSENGVFTPSGGCAAAETTGPNISSTFKISVRYIQNFNAGDKRFTQNFRTGSTYNNPFYGTPYNIVDSLQQSVTGTYVIGSKQTGQYEVYIAGSYEENALMLAEANIRSGNIETGLTDVDAVRTYQGAGVPAVTGTGLDLAGAMKELTRERRAALIFRGIEYYDARRWGWTYDISQGGGSYGNVLFNVNGTYDHNVTISYNFMDYWDIPADETTLNVPAAGSAPVKNPNY